MEKKKSGSGKRSKSPQLPSLIYGKSNKTAPPNKACAWKKSKLKDEGIQALEIAGLLKERATVGWNSAEGDAWPLEKNPDEIPCFLYSRSED